MTKQTLKNISLALIIIAILNSSSLVAHAAPNDNKDYEISGWIPYWRSVDGAKDALSHLDKLDTIHPFGYSVNADGTLNDLAKINKQAGATATTVAWQSLFTSARNKGVDIIPTITWTSGSDIDRILADKKLRAKHIKEIAQTVKREKFDGINIDYEGKLSKTRINFSLFLKELKKELGSKKSLVCAIEARTPPESYYRVVPEKLEYANDFKQIGKYCDQVQILAYDQGRADFKLNGEKAGTPYNPVADTDWVRKVVELAMKDIPKNKIILGAATYGNEYEVTVAPNWFREYRKLRSVTPPQALATAAANGISPARNKAGEQSFSYLPATASSQTNPLRAMLPQLTAPAGTPSGEVLAQKALTFSNLTGQTTTFNLVWWSDAAAIKDKLDLVRSLGLKGMAIFKIDAEEDPALWSIDGI
jgi:spore germination protein YaaH